MAVERPIQERIKVTKQFRFEMAHALDNHDGPCRNIHGHSYFLWITVIGVPLNVSGHPKNGMVADFADIKKVVQHEVVDRFDHALVLNENSCRKTADALRAQFDRILFVPFQPSCENLVLDIKRKLAPLFEGPYVLYSVRLQETPTSWAEWCLTDNI